MPRLACIIPALGNTESLESTLLSVLERRPDHCEVLVVLNAPYHDPYGLQGEIQFVQVPAKSDLIACLNRGIAACEAPIVHILASGWLADNGWIEKALVHFDDPRVAAVTPAIYDLANQTELLATGAGYRRGGRKIVSREIPATPHQSSPEIVGPLSQAAFYRKSALQSLGGMPAGLGEQFADIDLALSLRHAGWRMVVEPKCRVFAPKIEDIASGGFLSGLRAERLFWRHADEIGRMSSLIAHSATAFSNATSALPKWKIPGQLLGRMFAQFEVGHYRRYRLAMIEAKAQAAEAELAWQARRAAADKKSSQSGQQLRIDDAHKMARPSDNRQPAPSQRQKSR